MPRQLQGRARSRIQAATDHFLAGRLDQAAALCGQILEERPKHARALHLLGVVAFRRKDYRRGVELISASLAQRPDVAERHHNLASCLGPLGEFEASEWHYRRALELHPDFAEAYFNLSLVRRFAGDEALLGAIEQQLERTGLSADDQSWLHFAAAKICDDSGWYDRAFPHYEAGNAARPGDHDDVAHHQRIDRVIAAFDRDAFAARAGQGFVGDVPVFIVGMPRSGTTLVEQTLSGHPQVYAAGELPDIGNIVRALPRNAGGTPFPKCIAKLPVEAFRGFGESYVKRLRSLGGSAPRIIDKNPLNFFYLGLIALLLPGARIIHCRRDPLDTCLSCYFQRFRGDHTYSCDLETLGRYYREYERLMAHWRSVLPIPMLDVQYEEVVADHETAARRIVEFCGLPWHDRCLEFHRVDRAVSTASHWQVRQPVYVGSVGRWRRYRSHLGPLFRELGIESP